MLQIEIPDYGSLCLHHLVLDYNGTIARDGEVIGEMKERLEVLSRNLDIHVITADTFGSARQKLADVNCRLAVIPRGEQAQAKLEYVKTLGVERCVCMGNGRNDRLMLEAAALGIAVIETEGASVNAVLAADVVVTGALDGLDLLLHPLRLTATLRS